MGRVDDVINVSGHRIGTAEVESALVAHPECAEAAVVPIDHPIKGQAIYAYVTLMGGHSYPASDDIRKSLVAQVGAARRARGQGAVRGGTRSRPSSGGARRPPWPDPGPRLPRPPQVRKVIGPIATPDVIHWAPGLPKTRSGKIMRRILRKVGARRQGWRGWRRAARRGAARAAASPPRPQRRPAYTPGPPHHHAYPPLLQIASNEEDQLGDISTLADPSVVATLLELRGK